MNNSAVGSMLKLPDVCRATALKRDTVYRLIRLGRFPRPIKLSDRAVAWSSVEIDRFLSDRASERAPVLK